MLPYILFEKYITILALKIASPENRQLHRRTFVPYQQDTQTRTENIK